MAKHTLIYIGVYGGGTAYLDITKEEALRRYNAEWQRHNPNRQPIETTKLDYDPIDIIEFDDEFNIEGPGLHSVYTD